MINTRQDVRWHGVYRLARRVSRIQKRLEQKNALLPPHKRKPIKKDKRFCDAVHAYFLASKNALSLA